MTMTPCAGKHALFDSIDPRDHAEASELCATCPILLDCATTAEQMLRTSVHPEGTWGGQSFGMTDKMRRRFSSETRAERLELEDAAYTTAEARRAHSAYTAGDKSEWAKTGHRVYDRRRKNRNRTDGAA